MRVTLEFAMLWFTPSSTGSRYENVTFVTCNSPPPEATLKTLLRPKPTGTEAFNDESDVHANPVDDEDPMLI